MVVSGTFFNFVNMEVIKQKYGEKHFYIQLADVDWARRGDLLQMNSNGAEAEVVKVYRNTWWRRLLLKVGFKVRLMELKLVMKEKRINL